MSDIETALPPAELSDWDGGTWFWRSGPFSVSRSDAPRGASCCPDTPHLPYFATVAEAHGKTRAMGWYATPGEAAEACRDDVRRGHA